MRRHRLKLLFAAVVVVLAVLYFAGVLPHPPDAKEAISSIAGTLGPWTYLLVGAAAFLETGAFVGLIAPGETTVIVGGVIAGQGEISLLPLIGLVWISCVLGDTASFFIGRRLGRDFLLRHGPKFKITEDRLNQVESYFERHGGKTILIGRFVGLVRAISPFVAGSSGFSYRRFLPFSILGCGAWGSLFTVLGYLFYRSFDRVAGIAGQATLGFGIVVAIVAAGWFSYRELRDPSKRRRVSEWFDRQPLLRPAVAAARPVWRRALAPTGRLFAPRLHYVGDRLTPGDLGLELTGSLAMAGVGTYVFALYTTLLADGPRLTPADRELLNLGDSLRTGFGTDVAKFVTGFGSIGTVVAMLVAVTVILAVRRHRAEIAPLLVGSVLVYVAIQLAKNGIDRPRPANPVVGADKSSFPSGHAGYSTIWIAAAIALARAFGGAVTATVLIASAVVLAVAIGLTRIFLRVHFWSDVAGGWALGAAIFGLCTVAALIVARIRDNARQPRADAGPPQGHGA